MSEFLPLPSLKRTTCLLLVCAVAAGAAPYLFCLDFSDGFFNSGAKPPAECSVAWQKRLNQSGLLLLYTAAVLGLRPTIFSAGAAANRQVAEKLIKKLVSDIKSMSNAKDAHQPLEQKRAQLAAARRQLATAQGYPRVVKFAFWLGFSLVVVGTLMQVVAAGA